MSVSQATAGGQGPAPSGSGADQVQGTADASQGQQDGFWGRFPTVPVEQRESMEPHLKEVQGYLTRLEQQYAPFKPLIDNGYDAASIQAVTQFSQKLQNDPVGTTFELLESLQQNGLIHAELDLDAVKAAAGGEFGEDDPTGGDITEPTGGTVQDQMPAWATQMQQQLQQMGQFLQNQHQQTTQRTQDALLNKTVATFREELGKAGVDVSKIADDPNAVERWLVANLITNNMNVQQAVQGIVGFRDATARSVVEETETANEQKPLDLPNGAPPTRQQPKPSGDPYKNANAKALGDLERRIRGNAQGV